MKRHLIPGGRDRHGIARPLPQCTGGCLQGRSACDCRQRLVMHPDLHRVTLTQLDDDTRYPIERPIPAPAKRPRPADPMRRKRLSIATATAAVALVAFGVLLMCASKTSHAQTATVLVGLAPSQR